MRIILILTIILISCDSFQNKQIDKKNKLQKQSQMEVDNRIKLKIETIDSLNIDEAFYLIGDEVYARYIDHDAIEKFDNPLKNLIYIFNMHGQVENGGVGQFVDNSTGDFFEETLNALKDIGMDEYVMILETVKKTFPNNIIPKNMEERRNVIDNMAKTQEEEWEMEELEKGFNTKYYENDEKFKIKLIDYTKKSLPK